MFYTIVDTIHFCASVFYRTQYFILDNRNKRIEACFSSGENAIISEKEAKRGKIYHSFLSSTFWNFGYFWLVKLKGVCDSDLTFSRWIILKTKSSWEKPKILICRSILNFFRKHSTPLILQNSTSHMVFDINTNSSHSM